MNYTDILQKFKYLANNDEALYSLIEDRFFPKPLDTEGDEEYPLINCHLAFAPKDFLHRIYPTQLYLFDTYYVSENSTDQANELYMAFHAIINNNSYTFQTGVGVVHEDSGLMDVSGIYKDKKLYILTNTWAVRKIE